MLAGEGGEPSAWRSHDQRPRPRVPPSTRLLDSLSLPFGPATRLKLMRPALPDGDLPLVRGRA
jgi:hypothetical protein